MFKKILIALDGSESSLKALDYAAHLAKQNKSELFIISAAEPIPPLGVEGSMPSYIPQYQDDLHKSLEKMQKEETAKLTKNYPTLKITSEVRDGRPAQVIREAAQDSDLIVIGHRGHGGVRNWILGSVAKQIVDQCTAPVLVVKDPDYCQA